MGLNSDGYPLLTYTYPKEYDWLQPNEEQFEGAFVKTPGLEGVTLVQSNLLFDDLQISSECITVRCR